MTILISQNTPSNLGPYNAIREKFGVEFDFHPFFLIKPLSSREFRSQRINLPDYSAVVFSSRHTIDAYFSLCEELRVKVPETMKYFCSTELVAMYLQKHIVYRKRKIFFGDGTPESIISLIGEKHKGEKFLITVSEGSNANAITSAFDQAGFDYSVGVLVKPVPQDLKGLDLNKYNLIVLYNPADVKSLYENFPDFKQGKVKFISYGKSIVKAMTDAGLTIEVQAPSPEVPSVSKAIESYLQEVRP